MTSADKPVSIALKGDRRNGTYGTHQYAAWEHHLGNRYHQGSQTHRTVNSALNIKGETMTHTVPAYSIQLLEIDLR